MKRELITIENGIVSVPKSADIWMTQHEIARLFECFVSKINTNIRAILKSGVLCETNVCRIYHYGNGNLIEQYNPEMITALSFRIESRNAKVFRQWLMKKAVTANTAGKQILIVGNWNNCSFYPN